MSPIKQVFQFKIALEEIKPSIWRRIQISSTCTFWDLHVAIQDVMGWSDSHLHEFRVKAAEGEILSFGIPDPDGDMEILAGWKHKVAKYLNLPKSSMEYIYDFGDYWYHKIVLEEVAAVEAGVKYPRCLAGKRACPPDDCGGSGGYADLLEILSDPDHDEYEEMSEWVESIIGEAFASEQFSPEKVFFMNPKKRLENMLL